MLIYVLYILECGCRTIYRTRDATSLGKNKYLPGVVQIYDQSEKNVFIHLLSFLKNITIHLSQTHEDTAFETQKT